MFTCYTNMFTYIYTIYIYIYTRISSINICINLSQCQSSTYQSANCWYALSPIVPTIDNLTMYNSKINVDIFCTNYTDTNNGIIPTIEQ